jgi:enoyl-CoA hydratase
MTDHAPHDGPCDHDHDHGSESYENLLVERGDGVVVVKINRPTKMNALSRDTLLELDCVIGDAQDDPDVGAIIVTGGDTGKKPSFVAGADIAEMSDMSVLELRAHGRLGQEVFAGIENSAKPVLAAINGFAFGGGLELAMACHVRYAAKEALLGQPEINLGLIPGFAGTQRLARLVGRGRALEILLTGDPIGADEAYRLGLVNKVCDGSALLLEAQALAAKLAGKAPVARMAIIDAVVRGGSLPFADAQALEADLFGMMASTEDTKEGLAAFLAKRKPTWKGC